MSNLFYRNRRLLVLTICLILVAGLSSYHVLPRMEDPLLSQRVAIVNTWLPGASAQRVESLVTEKLEDELREIEEIKRVRSISRAGLSVIVIELRDSITDVDPVWSRVRNKIDDAASQLPTGPLVPEFVRPEAKAYALIVGLTWDCGGPTNYAILGRLAEQLEDRLKVISGTEKIDTFGDPDEEITVEIRPDDLAALGKTVADVSRQIQSSDAKVPAGQFRGPESNLLMEVDGELDSLDRLGRTPIHFGPEGRFVQLADIATIEKGIANPPGSLAVLEGRDAVVLGAFVRPDRRIDRWSERVRQTLVQFQHRLPRGVGLDVVFEQNQYVDARLRGLLFNLLLGGIGVVTIIFVMMGWRSALVVSSTLPLSVLMVLTGMRLLGIPIHYVSVTGLIIALGLLIDNAIVIVDEVAARLKEGDRPADAVSHSVRHLAVPLLGSTLTTALAFAPIVLMAGPAGEFVYSVAASVILAISSSFLLAMTVVPALAALAISVNPDGPQRTPSRAGWFGFGRRQLRVDGPVSRARTATWWRDGYSPRWLSSHFRRSLDWILRRPLWGVALGLALPVFGFVQSRQLVEQFFPPAQRNQFHMEVEMPSAASLAETLATTRQIRQRVLRHPQVNRVDWFVGESAPAFYHNVSSYRKDSASYAQALVQLRSADGVAALIHQLQDELDEMFPAARILVRQMEQGPPVAAPIEVRLFGPDPQRLRELGEEIRGVLARTPNVFLTQAGLSEVRPKLSLKVDEEQARLAGLDYSAIARQLDNALEGARGGSILEASEELPVRVRLSRADRGNLDRIASLDLLPPRARTESQPSGVPLAALARIQLKPETAVIARYNSRRVNEVRAFIPAGMLPAVVLRDFRQRLASSDFSLPPGYSVEYGGELAERDEAVGHLMANVGVLLMLMVATLVLSFGSFRMAGIIGVVAIFSIGLGLGALWLFGYPFGFMAIIGTMGLVGVAINDSIVVLAALRSDPQARKGDVTAVRDVVARSARHVTATSLTTMAGFTPLVLAGGEFWPPLAIAVAGGVSGATLLALYLVPSTFLLLIGRDRRQTGKSQSSGLPSSSASKDASRQKLPLVPA